MTLLSNPDRCRAPSAEREAQKGVRSALRAPRSARLLPLLCLAVPCILGCFLLGRHIWAAHHWRAAQTALERHDFSEARNHLKDCMKVRSNPEVLFLAARTARRAGDYEEAAERLRGCVRQEGSTPAVQLEQLLLRGQRGDFMPDDEHLLWSLVYQNNSDSLLILEALTQGYIYTYQLSKALVSLERWLERQPDAVQALLWRAQVCQSLHRYEEARNDYRRAVALDPTRTPARLQLANFLAFSGRADLAVEHFEGLWQQDPQNRQVLLGLAHCRNVQGRAMEAARLLDRLLHSDPKNAPALRERAQAALELGREQEAENWLRKCLALDSCDQEATYLLVLCLARRGNEKEAQALRTRLREIDADLQRLEELNRALGQAPENAALRYEAGTICLRNGQEQEGLRWLKGISSLSGAPKGAARRIPALPSGAPLN